MVSISKSNPNQSIIGGQMTLRDYMHIKRIKVRDFAEEIGVGRSRVSQLRNNSGSPPSLPLALKIHAATDGLVTPWEWGVEI